MRINTEHNSWDEKKKKKKDKETAEMLSLKRFLHSKMFYWFAQGKNIQIRDAVEEKALKTFLNLTEDCELL